MLNPQDFRKNAHLVMDWIADYFENLETFPVKSQVLPHNIYTQIPDQAPTQSTDLTAILQDVTDIVLPGITHWQHPNFHAYFPANSSMESLYAEFITAAIGAQCMIWETSPAAAELEEKMMDWLKQNMGIPAHFEGVIQDTASTATLVALLTAREWKTDFQANETGVPPHLRVYCSTQTHSSIEKAVKITGIGRQNLVKIPVDDKFALRADLLRQQIKQDIAAGKTPTCVVVAIGTTGTVAVDPLAAIAAICREHDIWLHVDAAYAGTALLLPEYRWMIEGIEQADSFVFNPHKWLFTNFDCSVYFVKNVSLLLQTFEILPEYLQTRTRGQVNDYRDWGVPLGRRFRALKLWFVLRGMGMTGIRQTLRRHIELNHFFAKKIDAHPHFELVLPPFLNFSCIRLVVGDNSKLNSLNERFLDTLNKRGKVYLSHTKVHDKYVLRVVFGQTYLEKRHVERLLEELEAVAVLLLSSH